MHGLHTYKHTYNNSILFLCI